MQIDFNDDERALLRELLEVANSDFSEEIYKTEDTNYKKRLKQRESALQSLMRKVAG